MTQRVRDGEFLGYLRGTRRLGGLVLAETEYAASSRVPSHAHEHGLCSLVLAGSFTERRDIGSEALSPGGLIYHPRHAAHAHDFGAAGGRCFTVLFGDEWMARADALDVRHPDAPMHVHRSAAAWLASQLYSEFSAQDAPSALTIEGLALALLGELTRQRSGVERSAGRPRWLRQAIDHLQHRFAESVSLADLAIELEVDPRHLARTFRSHVGCTMSEYVRQQRVECVRRALLESDRALSDIAFSAGFSDQAHMTRVFKRATGFTPASFRRVAAGR